MLDPWSWLQMKTNVEIRKELKASVFESLFLKVRVYQGLRWPPYHPKSTPHFGEGFGKDTMFQSHIRKQHPRLYHYETTKNVAFYRYPPERCNILAKSSGVCVPFESAKK